MIFVILVVVGVDYNMLFIFRLCEEVVLGVCFGVIWIVVLIGGVIIVVGLIMVVLMYGLVFVSLGSVV